jgi:hypothetical protein
MVTTEERYEVNPFLSEMVVKTKNQKVRVSNSAKLNDETWINNTTGELATTQLYTYKEVDETQFVKLFTQNIGLVFNLTAAGIKALTVLVFVMQEQVRKDVITLDYEVTLKNFLGRNPNLELSKQYFYRGVKELILAQIIAKHRKKGDYFINPNFVFNGDRLLFVNAIRKKPKTNKIAEDNQLELEI